MDYQKINAAIGRRVEEGWEQGRPMRQLQEAAQP